MPPRNLFRNGQYQLRPPFSGPAAGRAAPVRSTPLLMDASPERLRPTGIDTTILPALLARLEPGIARDLRRQLGADLVSIQTALVAALRVPRDFAAIVRQAHGLIALAGTAGAFALTSCARALLDAAHAADTRSCTDLAEEIFAETERLVDFVACCPLPNPRSIQ